MDRNTEITKQQQQSSKIYELLSHSVSPGQGLEMMMRTLEHEANSINAASENHRNNQVNQPNANSNESEEASLIETANDTTLELHPNIVLQNLGLNDETTEDRPYMCQVCQATYKTRTHLRRHMFVHLSNRPYPCSECGKGFNRKEHLNKHIEAVHSGTKYKCEFCSKEISRKDHLSRHIKNMHSSFVGTPIKTEPSCLDDQTILKVELPCGQKQKAHLSFLPPFSPGSSGGMIGDTIITPIQSTPQRGRYKSVSHVPSGQVMMLPGDMLVTPTTITSPKSSVSSRSHSHTNGISQNNVFNQIRNSQGTTVASGPNGEKKMLLQLFTCSECTATFTTEKDLTIHSRTHKPQPYKCAECPRAYTRREKLTEHIRCFHQGQKFNCEYCGKELSRKDHVLRHVRSVHPEVLTNRFVTISDGDMDSSSHSGHMRSSNSNPLQGNNGSNIPSIGEMGVLLRSVCHICLKVFGTSYHLSRHIESCHNGDIRPYACTACSKQFKRKDHLTKHMKSHCPSMREASGRSSLGARNSLNGVEMQNSNINSGNLNNLDVDLAGIHPDAIDSLQIEMMSPEDEEDENDTSRLNHNADEDNDEGDEVQEGDGNEISESINRKLKFSDGIPVVVERRDSNIKTSGIGSTDVDSDFNLAMNTFLNNEAHSESNSNNQNHSIKSEIAQLIQVSNNINTSGNSQRQVRYPCGHCQKEFVARNKLIEHLEEHSNEEGPQSSHQNTDVIAQSHGQQNIHQSESVGTSSSLWGQ